MSCPNFKGHTILQIKMEITMAEISENKKKYGLITNQQQIYKEKLQRSNNSLFLIFFGSILFLKISECVNM